MNQADCNAKLASKPYERRWACDGKSSCEELFQSETADVAMESVAVDAQFAGGGADVAIRSLQGGENLLAFVVDLGGTRRWGWRTLKGEVFRFYRLSIRLICGSFDCVEQFADIARPVAGT